MATITVWIGKGIGADKILLNCLRIANGEYVSDNNIPSVNDVVTEFDAEECSGMTQVNFTYEEWNNLIGVVYGDKLEDCEDDMTEILVPDTSKAFDAIRGLC